MNDIIATVNDKVDRMERAHDNATQADTATERKAFEEDYYELRDELLALADEHGGEVLLTVRGAGLPA